VRSALGSRRPTDPSSTPPLPALRPSSERRGHYCACGYRMPRTGRHVAHHCGTGSGLRKEPVALGYFVSVIVKDGPRLWPLVPPALIDVGDPCRSWSGCIPRTGPPQPTADRSYSDGPKGQPPRTSRQTRSAAYSGRSRPCQCLDRNAATNRGEQWRCPADTDIHPYRHASRRWRLQRRRHGTSWHLRQHRKRHYPLFKGTYNFHRDLTTVPTAQRASRPSGRSPLG
jgi:hypothetical protein